MCQRKQRLLRRQRSPAEAFNALQCAPESEHAREAHGTVYSTCPVHHRTARRPHQSELQRSNPNDRVTWLAHRTVSGGAPDYPVRPATDSLPNDHFGGWGDKYPQPPPFKASKFPAICIQYKSSRLHSKTQTRDQILSQVQRSFQSNSD